MEKMYPGPTGLVRARTLDAFMTFDQRTIDSTGAFLIGELERLDQTLHEPLVTVTWGRDIDLREDVTIGDEVSSFTNSTFAAMGGTLPGGKAWISKDANAIAGVSLDIGKTANPLTLWGMELKWTLPELESAQRVGRPVDVQKYNAMQLKHQMDIDEMVYVGDTQLGYKGLVNSAAVTVGNVANGATGSSTWLNKTPDEILGDVNTLLVNTWTASGYAVMPRELRVPPAQFSYLVSQKISQAGNMSILNFLRDNSLSNATNGVPLNIQPLKWLVGAGVGGTIGVPGTVDRMIAYTRDPDRVRYPMTMLQRTPIEYRSLYQITTYFGRLGVVEFVYPETLSYADGI
jgi:hypothetical protein